MCNPKITNKGRWREISGSHAKCYVDCWLAAAINGTEEKEAIIEEMTMWALHIATVEPAPGKTFLEFLRECGWMTPRIHGIHIQQDTVSLTHCLSFEGERGYVLGRGRGGGVPHIARDGTWAECSCFEANRINPQRRLCIHQIELALATPYPAP